MYLPNFDPTGVTNQSTSVTTYSREAVRGFLNAADQIGHNGILDGDGEADGEWATCMACAVVERARGKAGVDRTKACVQCFERYCWNGEEAVAAGNATMARRAIGAARGPSRDFGLACE